MAEEVADVLFELLEAAIHQLLFVRKIYPEAMFVRQAKYDLTLFTSRHEGLNAYISETLRNSRDLFEKGLLERLFFIVLGPDKRPLERFHFDITVSGPASATPTNFFEMREQLKAMLTKIQCLDVSIPSDPPEKSSFTLMIQTHEESRPRGGAGGGDAVVGLPPDIKDHWLPVTPIDAELTPVSSGSTTVRPIKSVSGGPLKIQLVGEW